MSKFEWVFSYWLPPLSILVLIFYASFQPASEQDISHILNRMTDRAFLVEQSQELLGTFDSTGALIRDVFMANWLFSSLLMLAMVAFVGMFIRSTFEAGRTRRDRVVRLTLLSLFLLLLSGSLLLLFATEEVASLIGAAGLGQRAAAFLNWVDFSYAGRQVNIENHGSVGLLNFLFRKTAHFVLYALLAFFLFRAFFVYNRRRLMSFVTVMIIVVITGSLDEFQQSFNPGRSGLVEDVILDSVGGLFGCLVALLLSPFMKDRFRNSGMKSPNTSGGLKRARK